MLFEHPFDNVKQPCRECSGVLVIQTDISVPDALLILLRVFCAFKEVAHRFFQMLYRNILRRSYNLASVDKFLDQNPWASFTVVLNLLLLKLFNISHQRIVFDDFAAERDQGSVEYRQEFSSYMPSVFL